MNIRQATSDDAPAIADLMAAVWQDEPPDLAHITRTIERGNRSTLVAEENGKVFGFIDAFPTEYWELDLMAVHPDAQGRGIGKQLTRASLNEGSEQGYRKARGLVAVTNLASQGVMRRLGLIPADPATLYVHDGQAAALVMGEDAGEIVEVHTFRYVGGWLTVPVAPETFSTAAALCLAKGWGTVGAVLPHADPASHTAAQNADYQAVGDYQWWRIDLEPLD